MHQGRWSNAVTAILGDNHQATTAARRRAKHFTDDELTRAWWTCRSTLTDRPSIDNYMQWRLAQAEPHRVRSLATEHLGNQHSASVTAPGSQPASVSRTRGHPMTEATEVAMVLAQLVCDHRAFPDEAARDLHRMLGHRIAGAQPRRAALRPAATAADDDARHRRRPDRRRIPGAPRRRRRRPTSASRVDADRRLRPLADGACTAPPAAQYVDRAADEFVRRPEQPPAPNCSVRQLYPARMPRRDHPVPRPVQCSGRRNGNSSNGARSNAAPRDAAAHPTHGSPAGCRCSPRSVRSRSPSPQPSAPSLLHHAVQTGRSPAVRLSYAP